METNQHTSSEIQSFIEKAEVYTALKAKLLVYKATDKASEAGSELFSGLLVMVVFIPCFALLNVAICICLGRAINSLSGAFFIMSGFYFLVGIMLALFRKKWLKPAIANLIIRHILK